MVRAGLLSLTFVPWRGNRRPDTVVTEPGGTLVADSVDKVRGKEPLMSRTLIAVGLLAVLAVSAACGSAVAPTPDPSPAVTPTASPTPMITPAPSPVATPGQSPSGVVVTFRVAEEQFRLLVTDADQIEHVRGLLAGGEEGRIPNGVIVRGETGVNEGWSWHIDPDSLEFADMTVEVCDGLPSHVEDGTLTSDRYCPWSARVIDVQPAD